MSRDVHGTVIAVDTVQCHAGRVIEFDGSAVFHGQTADGICDITGGDTGTADDGDGRCVFIGHGFRMPSFERDPVSVSIAELE